MQNGVACAEILCQKHDLLALFQFQLLSSRESRHAELEIRYGKTGAMREGQITAARHACVHKFALHTQSE